MSITWTKGDEWWLSYRNEKGEYRYPKHIDVGEYDDPVRYISEQRYAHLEKTLKEMWRWVRKTAYAEQGYLTVSELKEYARQFKECGVILDD